MKPSRFGSSATVAAVSLVVAASSCHDFAKIKYGTDAGTTGGLGGGSGEGGASGGGSGEGGASGGGAGGGGGSFVRALPPSCTGPTPPLCGAALETCCAPGEVIPALGSFSRGYDKSGQDTQGGVPIVGWQALNAAPAAVDSFVLDKYEVTVGRFRGFFAAYDSLLGTVPMDSAGRHPSVPMSGWSKDWTVANNANPGTMYASTQASLRVALDGCNGAGAAASITGWLDDVARANDDRPMSCVTWYEAFLFCIWDQGRLPTETEWNVAAAGGEQYRAYPWDPADQPGALTVTPANGNIGPALSFPPMRVGSFPDGVGRWGHQDLAGNVYEFVRDRATGVKPASYTAGTSNPIELVGDFAVIRGGSYVFDLLRARTAYRFAVHDRDDPPARRQLDLGWRCARSP